MPEQVLWAGGRLVFRQIGGAGDELMAVGKDTAGNECGVFHRADAEGEVDAFVDLIDKAFGDQNLDADVGMLLLEGADDGRDKRVGDAGRSIESQDAGDPGGVVGGDSVDCVAQLGGALRVLEQ